jgi:hypothetical protein
MQQCSTAHSAASVAAGSCVMQNIGLDGQESNCRAWHCTVLSMLLPTGLICDLHWHRQSSTINRQREMLQAGSKAISTVLAMSAVPVVLHFCMELTKTLAYGMHSRRKRMFERCRQATQQSTCKKETRRACGAGLSVSEELAMLGLHSGRNTVHDTTVPAAAVICNLLAQQHAHHACFGVLVRSNRPCTVQPVHG